MISQDYALSALTKERYKFINELLEQVLSPIPKSSLANPFSGTHFLFHTSLSPTSPVILILFLYSYFTYTHILLYIGHAADLNAFGWAFAAVSSRALRSPDLISLTDEGPTLVPGIDLASHSIHPNCEILSTEENFYLVTKRVVKAGEEVTVDYGPLTNEELLSDYGAHACTVYVTEYVV